MNNQMGSNPLHNVDPLDVLHNLTLRITRSRDLTTDLPAIAKAVRDSLNLESVSISLRGSGLIVHTGPAKRHQQKHTPSQTVESTPDAPGRPIDFTQTINTGSPTKIQIHSNREPAGFIRVSTRSSHELNPAAIDLLGKIGDTLAEHFDREPFLNRRDDVESGDLDARYLLDIVSDLSSPSNIESTIEPTLEKIATLLDTDRASLVAPDLVEPRLFSSIPGNGSGSAEEVFQFIATPAVRQALNSGQPQSGFGINRPGQGATQPSLLAIPLIAHNESVGVLVLERNTARPFSSHEQEIATIVGRHLSFGLEHEQRVRTSSRQNLLLSLVERVTAFIARSTDAEDLLALMTREIRRTFGYDCSIAMISGNRLVIGAIELGEDDQAPTWLHDGIPIDSGIMGRVARTGEPVFVRDVRNDPDFIDTGRNTVSEIALPIHTGTTVAGVLNVESDAHNPLNNLDYEILHILANHIGIALSNRQLIAAERDTRLAMEAIQRVSKIVAETLDPEESLRRIAVTLGETLGYPIVSLALLEGRSLVLRAHYGYEPETFPRMMSIDDGISGRVARTGSAILLEDVSTDPNYVRESPEMTSEVCVPIRCNGEIVGILNVEGTHERQVTRHDLHLLTTFAEHAGVLLNNARAYAALSQEATLDPMTGVPNLRFFQQELQERIAQAQRNDQPLSLAVIDLDDLKDVNDSHGHLAGDQVLRDLANRMMRQLRGDDLLARYAGDEFVALLPGVDEQQAMAISRRLLDAARKRPFVAEEGLEISLSLSIGVATYPVDADEATSLLRAADMAMYVAKESGKNRASNARKAALIRGRSNA